MPTPKITVITPVNDMAMYENNVLATLIADQYITIEDADSAAAALNEGIAKAENDLCVLCHQDVRFPADWQEHLEDMKYKAFGVCGVWGITMDGQYAGHVIEPRGHWRRGVLPAKAQSVDELLMIVRKSSGLRFDEAIDGWHLYGADICLEAVRRGMPNYVIDACVEHMSMGRMDSEFYRCLEILREKWNGKSPIKQFKTTCVGVDFE